MIAVVNVKAHQAGGGGGAFVTIAWQGDKNFDFLRDIIKVWPHMCMCVCVCVGGGGGGGLKGDFPRSSNQRCIATLKNSWESGDPITPPGVT